MSNLFDLKGRSVLVTGSTGHLGQSMSRALIDAGALVYLNARSMESYNCIANKLKNLPGKFEPAIFDITELSSVRNFFKSLNGAPLHSIVNNAYKGNSGTIETSDPKQYDESYHIAVTAAHTILQEALPSLREGVRQSGDASVINISSMYGMVSPDIRIYNNKSSSNPPFYGAAKAALIQWSRYAACEFGREGIRVNSISPGPFPPESVHISSPEFIEKLSQKVPMNRTGHAKDIQGPIIFLVSPASGYVNGTNLVVDGGWTAW